MRMLARADELEREAPRRPVLDQTDEAAPLPDARGSERGAA